MAKTPPPSKKATSSGGARKPAPCKTLQRGPQAPNGGVKAKTAGKKAAAKNKANSGASAAAVGMPAGVPAGLARILRPQAAGRWTMPMVSSCTPQYVEMVLRGALTGNHVQQWELFDLMLDTWPELGACQQELTEGVMRQKLVITAFAEEGEAATDSAVERQKLVSAAMRRMAPDVCADENDADDTLKDIFSGWFHGVVCLENDWHSVKAGKLGQIIAPRATMWAHPNAFAWSQEGRLCLRDGSGLIPFPQHKFLVGIHKAKSGSALGGSLLRPLAWWWCAANFASDWLLNLAQLFGLPFRWANHDINASQDTIDSICNMLQNMGSAGWAAFPAGTTLELKHESVSGDHSPQGELLDRADRYARMIILGQTQAGGQSASKGSSKAFGVVEDKVKQARIDAAGKYACKILTGQLFPSIIELNYGDRDEVPVASLIAESEAGLQEAQRDAVLSKLLPLSLKQIRQKYNLSEPEDDEDATPFPDRSAPDPTDPDPNADPLLNPEDTDPEEQDPDEPTDKDLADQLAALCGEKSDALFAKQLKTLAASLP